MKVQPARFLTSAVRPDQYPRHQLPEIALAGRSNVGKSSFINRLVNQRSLARTSSRPGRTQTINFYEVGDGLCLVDLPGYGYAEVPERVRRQWGPMVEGYFAQRENLTGIIQLVDARHDPTKDDLELLEWLRQAPVQFALVATKADKLSRSRRAARKAQLEAAAAGPTYFFSAVTGEGKDAIIGVIESMMVRE